MDIRDLWDFNNPAQSEAKFRDALAGADSDTALLIKTQIARSLGLQRKFDEATRVLDEVDAAINPPAPSPTAVEGSTEAPMAPAAPAVAAIVKAYAQMERGRVLRSSGNPEGARPYFDTARTLAQGIPDVQIDAIHMQALVSAPDEAIDLNNQAIVVARAASDPRARRWLGSLLNNTAWSYHDKGAYEAALNLFDEALKFREQEGDPEKIRVARWCVARCFRSIGRFGPALVMQRALLQNNDKDGYVEEEIGECLVATGEPDKAKEHFARAYDLLKDDPWLQDSAPARLQRLRNLAEGI